MMYLDCGVRSSTSLASSETRTQIALALDDLCRNDKYARALTPPRSKGVHQHLTYAILAIYDGLRT